MLKRLIFTLSGTMLAVALMGSVVFTGLSLSRKLMGHWRVVMVYDADVSLAFPPFTIELDKYGRVIGRSGCGTFTGKWSTGSGEVRFQALVPSGCNCGAQRSVEEKLIKAMATAREHRVENNGLLLIDHGRAVARLVPERT